MRKLRSLQRFVFYIIAFLVVMNVFFWTGLLWEATDEVVVSKLSYDSTKAKKVRSNIAVIDVDILKNNPSATEGCISCQRKIIVNLLKTINAQNQKPDVLILDFAFSNDTTQIKALKKEITQLQKDVEVYAIYDIDDYLAASEDKKDFFTFDIQQARDLYDLLGKRLHTNYTLTYKAKNKRFLIEHETVKYLNDYQFDGSIDSVAIESVVKRVNLDRTDPNDAVTYDNYEVPLGDKKAMEAKTYRFNSGENNFLGTFEAHPQNSEELDFSKSSFVIVGDLTNDRISAQERSDINFAGPYLVAWTLSEELAPKDQKIIKQYEGSMFINIIQTIIFALLTVILFGFLFKYVKRLQTKPLLLALLAIAIAFGFLALYVLLFLSQNSVPLIGFTSIGIIVAALLAWRYGQKFLVMGIIEGSGFYDVFISYSHNDYDWVKKNLYLPLKELKKEDGSDLNIFFDEDSIGLGEHFTKKYMKSIVNSKVMIPVISKTYNVKNHCQNELSMAVKRDVEQLMKMTIVTFNFADVPDYLTHLLILDISQNKTFIKDIDAYLKKELKPKPLS